MSISHLIVCHRANAGWLNIWETGDAFNVIETRSAPSLIGPVDRLLADMVRFPDADVTLTSRTAEELAAEPACTHPGALPSAVPGGSLTILLSERQPEGVWTSLLRDRRGVLHAGGGEARFQKATLAAQIHAYLEREGVKSFEPLQRIDMQPNAALGKRISAGRELLIRRAWTAAATLPEAFADPAVRAPRLTAQEEALRVRRIREHREMLEGRARTRRSAETARAVNEHNAKFAELRSRPKSVG